MSNAEMLEKVVRTTEIGAGDGGLLNAEQSNRFIDYMWDSTVLGKQVRTVRMRANDVDIDKVHVGQRLVRAATEAVDTGVNAGAQFTKISLTTKKFRLDWELSTESLEDNIAGEQLEDHLARLMATQLGNDLEDIAINSVQGSSEPGMGQFDGWKELAESGNEEGAAHVLSNHGLAHGLDENGDAVDNALTRATFNAALKAMPRKFMQRRNALKFFTGSNLIQDYLYSLTRSNSALVQPENLAERQISSAVRTEGPAGFTTGYAFGVPVQEVPLFDETQDGSYSGAAGEHGDVWLTEPKNLLWGIKREIQVFREFKPKKDTIEYTVYTRVGTQIENPDAFVVVNDVRVQS